jgi:hypothetical protein
MTFYLLVKTHNITGLKYLCKTSKSDYHKYTGSGIYWKDHLKLHGRDFTTELLKECKNNEEVRIWGQYYSTLWNVVNAKDSVGKKIWANLVPEEGQGILSETGKIIQNRPEVKAKNIAGVKQFYKDNPQVREAHRKAALENNPMSREEVRKKHKEKMETTRSGKNNPSYIDTVYIFQHKNGITETATQTDFRKKYNLNKSMVWKIINGYNETTQGWKFIGKSI